MVSISLNNNTFWADYLDYPYPKGYNHSFCKDKWRREYEFLFITLNGMNSFDDNHGVSVQRRTAEYQPPKSWRTWLIGRPLQTADAPHQTIGKLIGLAVFASDALSSTGYATQEMLVILVALGAIAWGYAFPISIAIVILLAILTLSYEQTVHAYPKGGGSYIVSRDNLGTLPAQVAAAALLTDYVLTVAVSISSGVAQIVSAFPSLYGVRGSTWRLPWWVSLCW